MLVSPRNLYWISGFLLLAIAKTCHAEVIELHGKLAIDKPVNYKNATLNMADGRFTVNAGGSLEIENSTINIVVSAENPYFVYMNDGSLHLKNNTVNVTVDGLIPAASTQSFYQFIQLQRGVVNLEGNAFYNNIPFTLGFFTTRDAMTAGITIKNNIIRNFHGGIYLVKSDHANVEDNTFENVSNANIYTIGHANSLKRNVFIFPGNLTVGNAIEAVNSNDLDISYNMVMSAAKYGIYLNGCQNINIANNKISDGSTYAIYLERNSYISITNNYFSQNRYGISGNSLDYITVEKNTFIQRFATNKLRQYWTDNTILLRMTTNLRWTDNVYKEAFTQEVPGDNSNTLRFVTFPQAGGVFLT